LLPEWLESCGFLPPVRASADVNHSVRLLEYPAVMTERRFFTLHCPDPAEMTGQLLFSATPIEYDHGTTMVSGTLLRVSSSVLIAALGLWLMGYISGAFPYLGTYEYTRQNMMVSITSIGPGNMLLFKGQEAFIDYEIDSADGFRGEVYLDIQPWLIKNYTPAMRKISGKNKGTLTITVPETGVYRFHLANGPLAHRENLTYSATWGAR
jgi:hypothetical protein